MQRFLPTAALVGLWLMLAAAQSVGQFTLNASDGTPLDRFGTAVAVDGNFAIVGAPGHADNGAAVVGGWHGCGCEAEGGD